MNKPLRVLACAGMLAASAAAQATGYEFSYTQLDNIVISGTFDGTANGNLVTDLSNISVFVDGVGFANNGHLYNYGIAGGYVEGSGVFSFNGLASNLALFDQKVTSGSFTSVLLLAAFSGAQTDTINYNTPTTLGGEGDGDYSAARWHLAAVGAVPEPSTYAMLLGGLALVGALSRRRNRPPSRSIAS